MSDQYVMDLHALHVAPPDPVVDRRARGKHDRVILRTTLKRVCGLKCRLSRLVPIEDGVSLDQVSSLNSLVEEVVEREAIEASSQCSTAAVSDDSGGESPASSRARNRPLDALKHQGIPELGHACVQ